MIDWEFYTGTPRNNYTTSDCTYESIMEAMKRIPPKPNTPDVIITTEEIAQTLRVEHVVGAGQTDMISIYGIPFESFPSVVLAKVRALELRIEGKHVMLCLDE